MLVRIDKDWDDPDLLRQTPGGRGVWDGVRFTLDPLPACDFFVLLNNRMSRDIRVVCPPDHVWALMQEPYQRGLTDWMVEKHERFARVLTHFPPTASDKYVVSHPAVPWHVDRTFDALCAMALPDKPRGLSWVVGNARDLPGHLVRLRFLSFLRHQRSVAVDLFGRAARPIADKFDGLAPYRYALAVENTRGTDYWTEKVADCFLTWTVPFYHGCPNLGDYFPEEAFVPVDIRRPEACLAVIRRELSLDNFTRRLPALTEARRRVLHEYQIFPHLARRVREATVPSAPPRPLVLPAYRRSPGAWAGRIGYKLKKKLGRL